MPQSRPGGMMAGTLAAMEDDCLLQGRAWSLETILAQQAAMEDPDEAATNAATVLRNIQTVVFETLPARQLVIEEPERTTKPFMLSRIAGHVYPERLRPWDDFARTHAAVFPTVLSILGHATVFESLNDIQYWENFYLGKPDLTDENLFDALYYFLEGTALEVAYQYCRRQPDLARRFSKLVFPGGASGLGPSVPPEAFVGPRPIASEAISEFVRDTLLVEALNPEIFWAGITTNNVKGDDPVFLVGNYEQINRPPRESLSAILAQPPPEDFISHTLRKEHMATAESVSDPPPVEGEVDGVFAASTLCHAFHCMITTGREYGYVTSDNCLTVLHVEANDPRTLLYFQVPYVATRLGPDAVRDDGASDMTAPRDVLETAPAHLISLAVLALRSPSRPASWIDACWADLAHWPHPYPQPAADAVTVVPATTARFAAPFPVKPPTRPYCTQACLHGLCLGLPLDDHCPNVGLHRVAARRAQQQQQQQQPHAATNSHPLTAAEVCARVVAQLDENMDIDCASLMGEGLFGRYGVILKLTVTGYGYTFVAKGVLPWDRDHLEAERAVYDNLAAFQGRLIPVCLGLVDLVRAYPLHTQARLPYLLLLSYAGRRLPVHWDCKQYLDWKNENHSRRERQWKRKADRTADKLLLAGLRDFNMCSDSMAWNRETRSVMLLDFDKARVDMDAMAVQQLQLEDQQQHGEQVAVDKQEGGQASSATKHSREDGDEDGDEDSDMHLDAKRVHT